MRYCLREQVHQRGGYFELELEAFLDYTGEERLCFNYNAEPRWRLACEMGAVLFRDYCKMRGSLIVKIIQVDWMPVDSSHLIALFATVQALGQALNYPVAELKLDKEQEVFIFPEYRWDLVFRTKDK